MERRARESVASRRVLHFLYDDPPATTIKTSTSLLPFCTAVQKLIIVSRSKTTSPPPRIARGTIVQATRLMVLLVADRARVRILRIEGRGREGFGCWEEGGLGREYALWGVGDWRIELMEGWMDLSSLRLHRLRGMWQELPRKRGWREGRGVFGSACRFFSSLCEGQLFSFRSKFHIVDYAMDVNATISAMEDPLSSKTEISFTGVPKSRPIITDSEKNDSVLQSIFPPYITSSPP